jgi:hypothetical protein
MKRVIFTDYPELNKLARENDASFRVISSIGRVRFLRNLGYKSAEWVPGTYQYSLSDEDYTWFILRWGG